MNKATRSKSKVPKVQCNAARCVLENHGDKLVEELINPYDVPEDDIIGRMKEICHSFSSVLDSKGRSCLHIAALTGKNQVVHYLVNNGANINLQDTFLQFTPLHFAVASGNIGVALILLKYGANVSICDKNGLTPLKYIISQQPLRCLSTRESPILQGFSWGFNSNYNLGLTSCQAREFPEQFDIPLKRNEFLCDVAMNKFHTVFLSNEGKVYVCGYGHGGRLGLESKTSVIIPELIKIPKCKIIKVSAGVDHTVLLNERNEVLACGINKYHQLGIVPVPENVPTPQVLTHWHFKNPNVEIIGIGASTYHSVLWSKEEVFTCGINAGQLGHSDKHNETYIDVPRSIPYIKHLDKSKVGNITHVAVSEGATVAATANGNIIACFEYNTRHIPLRGYNIKKVCCFGGILDGNLRVHSFISNKNVFLKVAVLSTNGKLYIWSSELVNNKFRIWYIRNVFDFCIYSQGLCLVNNLHEVFYTSYEEDKESPDLPFSDNFLSSKSKLVNDVKCIKRGKRVPFLYRTHSIYSDPKGNNFIALQYDPKLFLQRQSGPLFDFVRSDIGYYYLKLMKSKNNDDVKIWMQSNSYFLENNYDGKMLLVNRYFPADSYLPACENNYDVEILIGNRYFPANSYLISYDSEYLYNKIVSEMKKRKEAKDSSTNEEKIRILLPDIDPDLFDDIMNIIYNNTSKKVNFDAPNRFICQSSNKENCNIKTDCFVHIHWDEEKQEIVETLEKQRSILKDNRGRGRLKKDLNLNYLLKPYVDISNLLKLKHLQKALLLANEIDVQNLPKPIRILPDAYATDRVYEREKFSEFWDVHFKCEDEKIFGAHSCILSARSWFFEALLRFRWCQFHDYDDDIDISLPSDIFKLLLDFLYTNNSKEVTESRDVNFLRQVLRMSDQYMVNDLHILCQKSLLKCLTLKNCLSLLKFSVTFRENRLKDIIFEFICLNMPHYFDGRVLKDLKDLDEDFINSIDECYREIVLPYILKSIDVYTYVDSENELDDSEDFNFSTENNAEEPNINKQEEYTSFCYNPIKKMNISSLWTKMETNSLPSLEDHKLSSCNNSFIVNQTPTDCINETIDIAESKRSSSDERIREISHTKKRVRERFSSCQLSSSSNSESESSQEVECSFEPFSFEDLEERVPQPAASEGEWRTAGKSKPKYTSKEVEDLQKLKIGSNEYEGLTSKLHCGQSSGNTSLSKSLPNSQDTSSSSSILDSSPFPTLNESLSMGTVVKDSSFQSSRMPKFQPKSGKKSKKSTSRSKSTSEATEPQSPPPPVCAWGTSPKVSYASLNEVMSNEENRSSDVSQTPPSKGCNRDNSMDAFVPSSPLTMHKSKSMDESRYWNPITNSMVESCKETEDISFSSVMEHEVKYNRHLQLERNKPLTMIQLEEKAMKELLEYYGGEYNPEERITVMRREMNVSKPSWNIEYRHV